jgi:ferric-dicitrate binding protein FerR (iron transport regulator)
MDNIRIIPEYAKSKEEIWRERFDPLEQPKRKFGQLERPKRKRIPLWAYAACFLAPVLLVCRFYTITVETEKGEHREFRLPDRTMITLNAESKVSCTPYEWLISRTVRMEGEACFEVKHGNRFVVISGEKRVNVFGTIFNVYARSGVYCVTCLEGRVVVLAGDESIVLTSNMQATLQAPKFGVISGVTPAAATGWMQGRFVFDEKPLREVIDEVERQFNIKVIPATFPNHSYSGKFNKNDNPEEILEIIGSPFGINFSIE